MSNQEFEQLLDRLQSPERRSVVAAAHALGATQNPWALQPLLDLLRSTSDPVIRNAAAVGLRDLGDARAVPSLVELLRDPKTEGYRGTLLYALAAFDCGPHLLLLVDLAIHDNFEVSRQAFLAIENIESDIPPEALVESRARLKAALAGPLSDEQRTFLADLAELMSVTRDEEG